MANDNDFKGGSPWGSPPKGGNGSGRGGQRPPNIDEIVEKIQKFAKDDYLRKKIAKKGKAKYMKFFNSTIVADYIINNTFEYSYKKNAYLWENI